MDTPYTLHCLHIMANLPESYDRSRISGYLDVVDGSNVSCDLKIKSSRGKKRKKGKSEISESVTKEKQCSLDFYFKRRRGNEDQDIDVVTVSSSEDETDTASVKQKTVQNEEKKTTSPWKLAVLHTGTKNTHWHFIYVSSHYDFKSSSRLGMDIFNTRNKVQKIKCMKCLYNYLYSGNGREVVVDNTTQNITNLVLCNNHLKEAEDGLFHSTCEDEYEEENLLRSIVCNPTKGISFSNVELIELFLSERAFNDSNARLALSKTEQGRHFLFKYKVGDTIKIAIQTCKMLTYQEPPMKRLHRAKQYYLQKNNDLSFECQLTDLKHWIASNDINIEEFANVTYSHFCKKSGKKNNLFFYGPPSTGKSMIMESLVACNFNFTRLTGMVESSPFNFSSLLHANACFMDEIKLTDAHFEQWKLIAGGLPCSTDVKYQDKCDIVNCTLYTCSNYEIGEFCRAPNCDDAINQRTLKFHIKKECNKFFMPAPQTWLLLWKEYVRNVCEFEC